MATKTLEREKTFKEEVAEIISEQTKKLIQILPRNKRKEPLLQIVNEMFHELRPYIKRADYEYSQGLDDGTLMVLTNQVNEIVKKKNEINKYGK